MAFEYSWRKGVRFTGDPAQVALELNEIREINGGILLPENVVEYARCNPESAIGRNFEQDVKEAAKLHWMQTARQLIVAINVTIIHDDTGVREEPIQVHVCVTPAGVSPAQGYMRTEDAMNNTSSRNIVLANARIAWQSFQSKYRTLRGLREYILEELSSWPE